MRAALQELALCILVIVAIAGFLAVEAQREMAQQAMAAQTAEHEHERHKRMAFQQVLHRRCESAHFCPDGWCKLRRNELNKTSMIVDAATGSSIRQGEMEIRGCVASASRSSGICGNVSGFYVPLVSNDVRMERASLWEAQVRSLGEAKFRWAQRCGASWTVCDTPTRKTFQGRTKCGERCNMYCTDGLNATERLRRRGHMKYMRRLHFLCEQEHWCPKGWCAVKFDFEWESETRWCLPDSKHGDEGNASGVTSFRMPPVSAYLTSIGKWERQVARLGRI